MTHLCAICDGQIKEGAYVQCVVRTTYHRLKSRIAYALDKADLNPLPETLVHVDCVDPSYMDIPEEDEGANN